MLVILLGPERFLVSQALTSYLEKYAPADTALGDLNMTRLDGARITPDDLERAVQAMGFLADTRVVVVEGLMSRFGAGKAAEGSESSPKKVETPTRGKGKNEPALGEQFAAQFAQVPDSTVLILVERGGVAKNNTLLKAASRYGKTEEFVSPRGVALERWIGERARQAGVRISQSAQAALAAALPDLQTLVNEIEKLALYVGAGGTIDEAALRQMSFMSKQDNVFEMTSAAARRDTRGALIQLQQLMDGGMAPEGILPVLAWQVRTLIQLRDLLDRRVSEGRMAEQTGLSDFIVRKTIASAKQYTMPKLLDIHNKLVQLDHAVKTGRAEADMTLDALVVEMCRG